MVELPPRLCVITPCVPVGIVVFCPLGIWIASQSRLTVNSVFSYMASSYVIPSEVEESFILDPATPARRFNCHNYYATDVKNDEARMSNDPPSPRLRRG